MPTCEDNSRLRIPLPEICKTVDIGCVPLTDGIPDCAPEPDQLPFAYDEKNETLWVFACKIREWLPFKRFSLCQLKSVSLDNIQNLCKLLQIPVAYDPGTGCIQGTITLAEFAEQVLKCIKLSRSILCVNATTLKVTIEGLDSLPPLYIRGENVEFICGKGTEDDPLVIKTHPPICALPKIPQQDVKNVTDLTLAACADGHEVRIPYPPPPCEYPVISDAKLQAATTKNLIACVDDQNVKVSFPPEPCAYPLLPSDQVNTAKIKNLIACVDDQNVKVPFPKSFYDPTPRPCEYPLITQEEAEKANSLTIIACKDGDEVRFPLPKSTFHPTPEYICVPVVKNPPSGPPAFGTGPIRLGCEGEIWFWVCNEDRWEKFQANRHDYKSWEEQKKLITDLCKNVRFHGWAKLDDCYIDFQMTAQELIDFLLSCVEIKSVPDIDNSTHNYYLIIYNQTTGQTYKVPWGVCAFPLMTQEELDKIAKENKTIAACVNNKNVRVPWIDIPVNHIWFTEDLVGAGACLGLNNPSGTGTFHGTTWAVKNATIDPPGTGGTHDVNRYLQITVKNNFKTPALLTATLHGGMHTNHDSTATDGEVVFMMSKSLHTINDYPLANRNSKGNIGGLAMSGIGGRRSNESGSVGAEVCHWNEILQPGQSVTLYCEFWVKWKGGDLNCHIMMFPDIRLFNNVTTSPGAGPITQPIP